MTLGLSDQRRRSQRRKRSMRVLLSLLILVAAGVVGYRLGIYSAERPVYELEDTIDELRQENTDMNQEIQTLVSVVSTLKAENKDWETRYSRDVPTEDERRILELAKTRLADGVDHERLAFVINAVKNKRNCAGETQTKRFIVMTPVNSDRANSAVGFANGSITVTADGAATQTAQGAAGWFDPARPVRVRFTKIGGEAIQAEGKLPIHHSVVVGDTEHRFTITEGPRGFVLVTANQCDYP